MVDYMLYHEKQRFYFCGIHALNNLLGGPFLTKEILDEIANRLSISTSSGWWNNPYKSMFGLGNYDVNVLMLALKEKGYDTQYLDTRREKNLWETQLKQQETTAIGLVCNVRGIWNRHWKAIKFIKGDSLKVSTAPTTSFYNLDSKLSAPMKFGSRDELFQHMTGLIETDPNTTILLVSPFILDSKPKM
mmetsp:Transcript_67987/g.76118  ORF Transcript_67987/g.76118 Transcript_67987/m.76118 type:complete len:189 (+) Transcript_67987:103-669(+)